jgi:hypothetical protein
VAAGALTGVIGIFKLLAMLVPGSVVMVALLTMQGRSPRRLGSSFGWFALGLAIPLGLLGWWVARNSLWEEVRFAWVDYPPQMLAVESRPPMRLVRSAGEFFLGFAVLIIPAVLRMARPSERGRRLTLLVIVACLATGLVILLQLWWAYLFYMFLVPVLVLGIQGLDDLRVRRPGAAWAVALLIVVALSPAVRDFAAKASRLAGLAGGEDLATYQSFDPGFLAATADVASSPVPHGSRVYVLGDPLIMELLESEQSIPINGWSPEFWTDELWRRVASDLRSGTTEALFISDPNREFARDRSAVFLTAVEEGFVETARTADGSWYVPRDQ